MNTTAVFIELLIAGVQASIWVMVFLVAFAGDSWFTVLMPVLQQWATLVTFMVFTFWYTLGIIVDRFGSLLFAALSRLTEHFKVWKRLSWLANALHSDADDGEISRLKILASEKGVWAYLEFTRSRLRIMRSTTLNVLILMVMVLVFVARRGNLLGSTSALNIVTIDIILGTIIVAILFAVSFKLKEADVERLCIAEKEFGIVEPYADLS